METLRGLIVLAVLGGLLYLFFGNGRSGDPAQVAAYVERISQPTPAAPADPMPNDERQFLAVAGGYAGRWQRAPNEMAQGALRPERARDLCAALNAPSARNWVGTVSKLSSNDDGLGVLSVELDRRVTVETWNNSFSDLADHTLIPVGSSLHAEAMGLREGQPVVFSGTFLASDSDCIREASLTMSGGMENPEFLFRFQAIRPSE